MEARRPESTHWCSPKANGTGVGGLHPNDLSRGLGMWTRAEHFLLTAWRPLYGASGAGSSPTSWRALDTPPPGAFLGPQPLFGYPGSMKWNP